MMCRLSDEKSSPISRVPNKSPIDPRLGLDLYSQAQKVLSLNSPFDSDDLVKVSPFPSSSSLPRELSTLLNKYTDNRKKRSSKSNRKARGAAVWVDTEEFFRDFGSDDVEMLRKVGSLGPFGYNKWFLIPGVGNENAGFLENVDLGVGKNEICSIRDEKGLFGNNKGFLIPSVGNENAGFLENVDLGVGKNEICSIRDEKGLFGNNKGFLIPSVGNENAGFLENVDLGVGKNEICSIRDEKGLFGNNKGFLIQSVGNGNVGFLENVDLGVGKNEIGSIGDEKGLFGNNKGFLIPGVGDKNVGCFENGDEKLVRGDSVGKNEFFSVRDEKGYFSSGAEWLLGCKEKVHVTTERPSKKRKLFGENAGLEKLLVSCPVGNSANLCDYCGLGDNGDRSNALVACCSCGTAVHQKCYGVEDFVSGSWSCNWCKSSDLVEKNDSPCVLCPKKGGALKPVSKSGVGSDKYTEFSHLFCCQWIPELYIEDTKKMEPVMNIEGIKDTRMKLVCNVCKVKCGACIRCSNGTCRSSFHPICAREAGNKMEIWGKLGSDDVELRAYCSKHSKDQNDTNFHQLEQLSVASCSDSQDTKPQIETLMMTKPQELKIGKRNGDKVDLLNEEGLSDARLNSRVESKCDEAQRPVSMLDSITNADVSTSDSTDYRMILKKLIDRGKVNLNDIASEIGVSPDSLALISSDNHLVPDLRSKIVTWLRNNAYMGCQQKKLKVKIKSSLATKNDRADVKDSNSALVALSDVPAESVSPYCRTKNDNNFCKGNEVLCSLDERIGDELVMDEAKTGEDIPEDADNSRKEHVYAPTEKLFIEPDGVIQKLTSNSHECEEGSQDQEITLLEQNTMLNFVSELPKCSILETEVASTSYIHPVIREKIIDMEHAVLPVFAAYEVNGAREQENSFPEGSSSLDELIEHLNSNDKISGFDISTLEQLAHARNIDLLKTSPRDEVEGELLYYQHMLLNNAVAAKHISDDMISEVVKSLPQEIDVASKRKWNAVIVNQYMCEIREAKKQGRKERRHKEAQEVLSAATAAAAASSRLSSLRKDTTDESSHQQSLMKVTVSKMVVPRGSSEMKPGSAIPVSNSNKNQFRTCDICRRSDTVLNPILVCSGCKVAVHLDCYRSVNDYTGPWYCELCEEELLSRKPQLAVECRLCGESTGAFRKSIDGQWVHAFCAEWVLEAAYKRGQMTPIEGMESVAKGSECHICHHKHGACIKCNYGHCHSMFHPSCARNAGLYMIVKSIGSKLQHKAYCQRHGLEQRAKAANQRHGTEALKNLKQVRVELERLRLLCERIIKREKLKRELVLCSQDVLVSNREAAALSTLVRSPVFPTGSTSESATISLRGNTDDCRSESETTQTADDVTIDSTVPGKRRIKFPLSKKTDDSSTSRLVLRKPRERVAFAGKQIPHRPLISKDLSDGGGEKKSKSRKV